MKMNSIKMFFIATNLIVLLNACKKDDPVVSLPTLSTLNITAITISSAESGGNITSDGGATVTERGVCYKKGSFPNITNDLKTSDASGSGQFTSSLVSLEPGALYYARAYATNSAGTAYGEQISFKTLPVAIGNDFGGGKVAYILQPLDPNYSGDYQHGLIATPADLPVTNWGAYTLITSTPHGIGNGNINTSTITLTLGAGTYAAKVCADLIFPAAGYSDWYLPSIDELNELYLNQGDIGGFGIGDYWTSCQYDINAAWKYAFGLGTYSIADKASTYLVRPVRSF
ncbi:MAG: DUF1566 domain-containing protein [Ferruginibacter sp.]